MNDVVNDGQVSVAFFRSGTVPPYQHIKAAATSVAKPSNCGREISSEVPFIARLSKYCSYCGR